MLLLSVICFSIDDSKTAFSSMSGDVQIPSKKSHGENNALDI